MAMLTPLELQRLARADVVDIAGRDETGEAGGADGGYS
jgi:hypothetical protein